VLLSLPLNLRPCLYIAREAELDRNFGGKNRAAVYVCQRNHVGKLEIKTVICVAGKLKL